MPDVVINELSAVGQATNPLATDELMLGLARALQASLKSSVPVRVYKHSELSNRRLCGGATEITVHHWLMAKSDCRELRTIRSFLIGTLLKRPNLDLLIEHPQHVCHHTFQDQDTNHSFSGLAGAAHLDAALLSFIGCERFPRGSVSVRYGTNEESAETKTLSHYLDASDVERARRKYEPHAKHTGGPLRGARGTPMDLSDGDAQAALDQCVAVPSEKRVCSRFRGKIYVFHPHRAEENYYHGFPMDEAEVCEKMPTLYRLLPPAN